MKQKLTVVYLGLMLTLFVAAPAFAQVDKPGFTCDETGTCTYTPLEPISPAESGAYDMATFIKEMFKILFSISGLIAVVALTAGGIQYMMSEVPGIKAASLDRIKAAMYGILILIGSYVILHTINPQLLEFKLDISPTIPSASGGASPSGEEATAGGSGQESTYQTYTAASEGGQRYAQQSGEVLVDTQDYGALMFSDMEDLTNNDPGYTERNRNFYIQCGAAGATASITTVEKINQVANVCAKAKQ
jgi:hypothetical protein